MRTYIVVDFVDLLLLRRDLLLLEGHSLRLLLDLPVELAVLSLQSLQGGLHRHELLVELVLFIALPFSVKFYLPFKRLQVDVEVGTLRNPNRAQHQIRSDHLLSQLW